MSTSEVKKNDELPANSGEENKGEDVCGIYKPGYYNNLLEWERECRNVMLNSGKFESDKFPQYPGFVNIENRKTSYEKWPVGTGVTSEDLSVAGLFYSGHGDRTFCFQCGGCLESWCQGDIPLLRHVKRFPKCDFIAKLCKNMPINDFITNLHNGKSQNDDGIKNNSA